MFARLISDVAPRFARAAGEEWQEGASKRQSVNVTKSTTILNRSPMIPAAAQQQQPPTNKWASPVTTAPLPGKVMFRLLCFSRY